jgi:sulfate adenylyltransferase subunit 2
LVPLYFAAIRPVVRRSEQWIMVDDERFRFASDERIEHRLVRFRTMGDYPLTGAHESSAATVAEVIQEMLLARNSERQGRLIDHDEQGSMEQKKREGYF